MSRAVQERALTVLIVAGFVLSIALYPDPPKVQEFAVSAGAQSPAPWARPWVRGSISHYGEGDGFMGQRTACGKTVTPRSMFVAAGPRHLRKCGLKITILYRGKKFRTRVQDAGGYQTFDAAPGLRRKMRFRGVVKVRYRKGWGR